MCGVCSQNHSTWIIDLRSLIIWSKSSSEQPPNKHRSLYDENYSLSMNGYSLARSSIGESCAFVMFLKSEISFLSPSELIGSPNFSKNSSIVGDVTLLFFLFVAVICFPADYSSFGIKGSNYERSYICSIWHCLIFFVDDSLSTSRLFLSLSTPCYSNNITVFWTSCIGLFAVCVT